MFDILKNFSKQSLTDKLVKSITNMTDEHLNIIDAMVAKPELLEEFLKFQALSQTEKTVITKWKSVPLQERLDLLADSEDTSISAFLINVIGHHRQIKKKQPSFYAKDVATYKVSASNVLLEEVKTTGAIPLDVAYKLVLRIFAATKA